MTAQDLAAVLKKMRFSVEPAEFALVAFESPPVPDDFGLLQVAPAQLIREVNETTLLIRATEVAALRERHSDLRVESPLLWIRFEATMDWVVVGFLAHVTAALAEAGVPIGAVCSFSRDHLFVNAAYREATLAVLNELFPS